MAVNLTFRLRFVTQPGQSLALAGENPLPGHPVPMTFRDREHWEISIPLSPEVYNTRFNYSYVLRHGAAQATDWGQTRQLRRADFKAVELLVVDSWNTPAFYGNAFATAPFKNVLLAENFTGHKFPPPKFPTHTFRVKAPLLQKNQTLCLLGEGAILGDWRTTNPVLLDRIAGEEELSVQLDLRAQKFPLVYKYGVFDVEKKSLVRFEAGANRELQDELARDKHTLVRDGFANLPDNTWRGAGVAVPVFSLRSENGFGTGEFLDLKPLADWGKQAGIKLIQLLPVNDTGATGTWRDSYPYAAISAFALHPLYLNLAAVADKKNQKYLKPLEAGRVKLNRGKTLDYEAVMKLKLEFLRKIFPSQKAATFKTAEYKEFFAENRHWLEPYGAFCFLRDKHGTADFSKWPEHSKFDARKIAALTNNNSEIAFHYFLQFHLHLQLTEAAAYAHKCGIVVKGDIAIGVFRHGVDAWQHPELFNLDLQAGAPPDPFAAKGQNWGFPTYNWPRMAADGFAWWKKRFAQMAYYFDAFRIDHILGFFRIWSSPAQAVEGILGYFVPAIPLEEKEFQDRGIHFDRARLTRPFITDGVLGEIFGHESDFIRREFLQPTGDDNWQLKPKFSTQRQVENHFAALEQNERNAKLKTGLFDLISDVILLEAGGKLHFRFGMEQTASFKNLAPDQQAKLKDLYVDYFFRRQDEFWMREAMQKLPALKRVTKMLVCGEDLGMVPACVPEVMRDLGFLSLEIQRMPKNPAQEFSRPADAPYLSVVTPSTHDMSTIRGWWAEDRALTQKFFNRELGLPGEAPAGATPEIVEAVVRQHLASPAMWSVFQLQDLLGLDDRIRRKDVEAERINVPAVVQHYWCYRMHLTLEKLQREKKFNARLAQLLRENGR
ncbi:MAG TPA: 4-alpha-glucanotransferase [Candidatus Sulfotelmatobacter sp.]|nr:4-alpha-glucanotransferase [Candidatus Sulfotelmatobacter sp.]